MIYEEFIGAIKIKDGLFIGDQQSVKDLEFIITNKVTHIINAAGKQVDNMLENLGISYLTFYWQESDKQILFEKNLETVNQIVDFIEEANQNGESCLVHSVRGQSRACCILTAYFMRKYQWTLLKTLDYLNSRRPDLEIRATFFEQLKSLEAHLQQTGQGAISQDWNHLGQGPDARIQVENSPDEVLIRNTYVNSKQGQIPDYYLNIGKPQRFGGYSPYKKPAPTKIIWLDEVSNNKKKLVQVLNQSQSTGKKGVSVQHRKPSPAPFKRAQQQALKQLEQQQGQLLPQNQNQDYIDSILKGSNKIFKKVTGEELTEIEINQINVQKSNENSANKPPQNPMTSSYNKLNSNRATQQESDAENSDSTNPASKSMTNKENSSRAGSTRDESLLQDKNANEIQYQSYQKGPQKVKQEVQQVKVSQSRSKEAVNNSQSLNNQIYNNQNTVNNNTQIRSDNSQNTINNQNLNIKNKFTNDGNGKVNNMNGNIINLTVNNFVNSNVATGNVVQQGFQIANVTSNGVIGNSQQIPVNYDMNIDNQPFIVQYPQNGIDYSNNYVKGSNTGLINNSNNSSISNSNSAGKQYKQFGSDPSKLQNYYKFVVDDKVKNQGSDQKGNVQGSQLPMAQQIIFQNQQMLLMQKQQQQQQQHQALSQNIQLTQQQQQAQQFNIQQIPIQILQNQNTSQNSNGQNSNSQVLSKMLSKNNTYHHSDMVYQKVISKSFNQSKMKQEMVFGQNQYQFPKEINNYSLIKQDLSDSKITKNMLKQKQNIQNNSQQQQQPISHKFPIKANPDLFEKRPNSANTSLPQGRSGYNGFVVMTNNFLMGTNHLNNNNNNFNENDQIDSNNINKRPSSTGGGIRSFSPGSKNMKPQNLPNSIKPQLIVTNQNGSKKTGMRYPSPAINSSSQNTYQMSMSQKNKWK